MPEVTYELALPYPPEVVFAFVADAENNPRWHEHVNETHWIDPPPKAWPRASPKVSKEPLRWLSASHPTGSST